MKYYSATIRLTDRKERAVIVKAASLHDAERDVSKWRGRLMNITEVLLDQDMIKALKREDVGK